MSDLTNDEKLALIIEICKKHDITAYEIGEKTTVSNVAAHNILTGVTKKPRGKTLNIILTYLENTTASSKPSDSISLNRVSEPKAIYPSKNDQILSAIERLELLIRQKHAVFSQALEISLLDTTEIREHTKSILKNTEDVPGSFERLTALIQKRLGGA